MVSFNVNPTDRPTTSDAKFWAEEATHYRYHAANPRAPTGSGEAVGWGIPTDRMPPADAIMYVLSRYRQEELGLRLHVHTEHCASRRVRGSICDCPYTPLHPMFKWSFVSSIIAHFLWFRTGPGANWVMSLYGTQEVEPFADAYAYYWIDKRSGAAVELLTPNTKPIYEVNRYTKQRELVRNIELRIFREWERCLEPACSAANPQPVEQMKKLFNRFRSPYANQDAPLPDDGVWHWVSEVLRDWFLEPKPNKEWPTHKPNRITGWQWVKGLERKPGVLFFEGMSKVPLYKGRAYRLKDARGGIYWCGGEEMRLVPLKELYEIQQTMNDDQLEKGFRCVSCRKRRTCVPVTGEHRRCCHCFSVELERDEHPTLDKCTMNRECRQCPDVIQNNHDLVRLKNSLSRPGTTGPVWRP
jgi:hypothetical protein